jgi:hypothetical protein
MHVASVFTMEQCVMVEGVASPFSANAGAPVWASSGHMILEAYHANLLVLAEGDPGCVVQPSELQTLF